MRPVLTVIGPKTRNSQPICVRSIKMHQQTTPIVGEPKLESKNVIRQKRSALKSLSIEDIATMKKNSDLSGEEFDEMMRVITGKYSDNPEDLSQPRRLSIQPQPLSDNQFVIQCKTEAKRLLKIAKANPVISNLSISNLSEAQDLVAKMKGKTSWHALIKNAEAIPVISQEDSELVAEIIKKNQIDLVSDSTEDSKLEQPVIFGSTGTGKLLAIDLKDVSVNLNRQLNFNLITAMMLPESDSHGGDMWRGRAMSMLSAVTSALIFKCEASGDALSIQAVRDGINIVNIINLLNEELPKDVKSAVKSYLYSLPGFSYIYEGGGNDVREKILTNDIILEQHGYIQMQLAKSIGFMSDDCGDVFSNDGTLESLFEQLNLGKLTLQINPSYQRQ